ncbi:MAG: hypothetical protein PUI64_04255 [Treponema succinifaciens]|nr:hypothetical protein [Treponema succinifaciens]MDD6962096.1 hypothetical protein [Treponema succinifaciens]MDY5116321.1 hypothetical protein [Treponema succinifaciens]
MKKLIFSILPAFLFAFISCMNMSSGSGENGSVRVALPGSSRAAYNKDDADKFIVRLYNDNFDQTEEGSLGGVIEFGELEPGTYIAEAEAWNTAENLLEGSGSAEIKVKAGETTDCTIKMILEGVFYSKYMLLPDYRGWITYAYDYSTCTEKKTWSTDSNSPQYSYFAEGNDGSIYYTKLDQSTSNYKIYNYNFTTNNEGIKFTITKTNTGFFDGCYDSTTDIYWLIRNTDGGNLYLYKKNAEGASEEEYNTGITQNSFGNCAIRGENLYYSFDNSIEYATFDYASGTTEVKAKKTLADFGVSGTITDMAVLEDGTVAVLVRSVGVGTETEGFGNMSLSTDGSSIVYSRGALVLLSSDLSKVEKVIGWTDSQRTISATNVENAENYVKKWTSITAYIPDYAERNSHFYGPMRIVAIRPKELVIADCGANFVLPDYDGKKNGKMYAHNRLMTVNLRNFAIGCKKEFSESELKFKDLMISGGSTDSYTIQASSSYNACETEK